ncbi:hypothetical protein DRN46_02080 [Thermococci archaeon]|nr:MAG: hypothetical protein DRN46_02080 [Thermococci archaeon]
MGKKVVKRKKGVGRRRSTRLFLYSLLVIGIGLSLIIKAPLFQTESISTENYLSFGNQTVCKLRLSVVTLEEDIWSKYFAKDEKILISGEISEIAEDLDNISVNLVIFLQPFSEINGKIEETEVSDWGKIRRKTNMINMGVPIYSLADFDFYLEKRIGLSTVFYSPVNRIEIPDVNVTIDAFQGVQGPENEIKREVEDRFRKFATGRLGFYSIVHQFSGDKGKKSVSVLLSVPKEELSRASPYYRMEVRVTRKNGDTINGEITLPSDLGFEEWRKEKEEEANRIIQEMLAKMTNQTVTLSSERR